MTNRRWTWLGVVSATAAGFTWYATAQDVSSLPTVPVLTLALAERAAAAANQACRDQGFATTTTVVDASGTTIAQIRNDGATAATVDVSHGKAYAAAGFKTPTDQLRDAARDNPGFIAIPRFIILGGGLPIASGSSVVGALGVSGAPTDEIDKTCAQAGLAAIGLGSGGGGAPDGGGRDGGQG